ncbi:MAG: indole-3-glycerol phosphate synthase TrpC [Longimicrobiales bacterium]
MDRNARGVLDSIVAAKRREIDRLRPAQAALVRAAQSAPPPRSLESALRAATVQLIAEFKRRSPSAGWISQDAQVTSVVPAYEAAGAAALSVLTDREFFGGNLVDLEEARKVSRLPVLRKDFILDELQILEARAAGADAILLIVRILEQEQLTSLLRAAVAHALDVLVEAHDANEVERALAAGARVLGINNRDLSNFQTDSQTAMKLLSAIPSDVIVVAESGVRGRADVERYGAAGFHAVLIGETLMRAREPAAAAASFVGCARASRVAAAPA